MKEDRIYKVLHSPFDIKTHNDTFVCYCELCITEDGVPHYAVPSHHEFMIQMICEKKNITRDELQKYIFDNGFSADFVEYMMKESGCILVWWSHIYGKPNEAQKKTLKKLIDGKAVGFSEREYEGGIL